MLVVLEVQPLQLPLVQRVQLQTQVLLVLPPQQLQLEQLEQLQMQVVLVQQ
jgi:hypothetical protein